MHFEQLLIVGPLAFTLAFAASFACFAQAPTSTMAPSPVKFTGTWKENASRRKLSPANTLKFQRDTQGNLEERRGGDARPVLQPVRFDGRSYPLDGSRNTILWKQIDKNHFERTLAESGKLVTTRRLQISADGKTLSEDTELTLADGRKAVTTMRYHRTTGEAQGLAATWEPDSYRSTIPNQLIYEAIGNRLRVSTSQPPTVYTAALDGKPVSVTGPAVITGTTAALKLIDAQTMEVAQRRDGVPTAKQTVAISADGKVMTVTTLDLAPNASREAGVTVFERQ